MPHGPHLTAHQIADILGVKVSTITTYAARGQMPPPVHCPCCGRGSIFPTADIDQWIKTRNPRRTKNRQTKGKT